MNKPPFDGLIERLTKLLCRLKADNENNPSRETTITVASKLFDITYAMRDVERELEALNSAMIEDLQRHESMAAVSERLLAGCDMLTILFNEIQVARQAARFNDIDDYEHNRVINADFTRRLREIISEIIDTRDDIVAEITSVDQGVVFLLARLEELSADVKFETMENAAFHDCVNTKEMALLRRARELVGKLNELKASTIWREARKSIRDEMFPFF